MLISFAHALKPARRVVAFVVVGIVGGRAIASRAAET
jgi:hypothetical protein